jgi:hypothetical protein
VPPAPTPQRTSSVPASSSKTRSTTRSNTRSHAGTIAGTSLAVAAIGAGAGSLVLYRGALDDRDRAAAATSYDAYEDLVARSDRKHTLSLVVGAAGAAALTTSVIVFVVSRRGHDAKSAAAFQIAPSSNGALATWRTPF